MIKANRPLVGPGPVWGVPSVEGLSEGSYLVLTRVLKKTMESSKRLGRQVRLRIEPGTSCQPVLSAEPFCHWRGGHTYRGRNYIK